MWLEACCGPSNLQSEGAVLVKECLSLTSSAIVVKQNHFFHDAYILGMPSGKHQAFLRDIQNRSVEIVQHQARLSGINPYYASPNLMQEARRECQTPRALSSEPSVCNHRVYINHLDMLKHKTVRERDS